MLGLFLEYSCIQLGWVKLHLTDCDNEATIHKICTVLDIVGMTLRIPKCKTQYTCIEDYHIPVLNMFSYKYAVNSSAQNGGKV